MSRLNDFQTGPIVYQGVMYITAAQSRMAVDAASGDVLFRFHTGGAIGGGVVTYEEGGNQYVAVMSGRPSPFWISDVAGAPAVFLFALS